MQINLLSLFVGLGVAVIRPDYVRECNSVEPYWVLAVLSTSKTD